MIGETISHYKILEKLGEGGMGVVYKAQDTKLDRYVAIKFLSPHLSKDENARKRFIHEAKAASALNHPNIGVIYEIDETPEGQTFMAMAHYEAETLREKMDRTEVGVEDALDITVQIASGLAKAHEKGIVHRDIKPSNILITRDGRAEIIDFGLAKLADKTRLTKEGITIGTVAYMSPEQAKGEEVDERSDIFSLGVVLYEMLTGQLPFKGEHEAALLYEIVHEEPGALSTHRDDVPMELQHIIDKTLNKRREERYQSAQSIIRDIEVIKDSSKGVRTSRLQKTGRVWKYVFPIIVVGVIVSVVLIVQQRWREPAIRAEEMSLAIVDFSNLVDPDDPTISLGLTKLLENGLIESSPIRVVSRTLLMDLRRRLFGTVQGPIEDAQALEIARKSGATLLLSGQIARAGDAQYVLWQLVQTHSGENVGGSKVDGEDLFQLADGVIDHALPIIAHESGTEEMPSSPSVNEITTVSSQAYQHYVAGMLAREEGLEGEEVKQFQKAISLDSTFALAYFELSQTYTRESGLARVYAEKAWEQKSRLSLKDRMRLEAWLQYVDFRSPDALETYREMLARWPDDREILLDLSGRLYANWYHAEALQVSEKGLALYPDNLNFSRIYWLSLASYDHLDKALEVAKNQTRQHPLNPGAWDDLGLLYVWLSMPDSAEVMFNHALTIEPHYVWSKLGLGANAYFRGDVDGAIEAYEQILKRSDLTPGTRLFIYDQTVNIYPGLCVLYMEAGRFKRSLEVIEESRQYASDPESELRFVRVVRNQILLRIGRAEEVLNWAREASHSEMRMARLHATRDQTRALVVLDSLEAARSALEELRATEQYWGGYTNYIVLKISAEIALAEGDAEGALTLLKTLKRSHGIHRGSLYDIEFREALAKAYRMAGRLDEAVTVHQEMLRIYGGHALSHYELGKLYEEMNRPSEAKEEYETFLEMWSNADEGLPQLEDARTRLAKLKSV